MFGRRSNGDGIEWGDWGGGLRVPFMAGFIGMIYWG